MNILRLSPDQSVKSGITDYSINFDKILLQEKAQIIKAKYLLAQHSTWWLPFDFFFRNKYWTNLLNNIDIIHAEIGVHQSKEILTTYYLLRKKKDLKIFVTVHDPGVISYRIFKFYHNISGSFISKVIIKIMGKVEPLIDKLFFRKVINYIFEQSSGVFVFNKWGSDQLSARYPKTKYRITVINHPVFDFPKQRIKPIKDRKIVFAGFWSENKGIENLIRAYLLLKKEQTSKIPNLILAGGTQMPNSSYTKKIKKLVEVSGLNNYVKFIGYLKEDEMFKIFSEAFLIIPYNNNISGSASGIYIRGLQAGAVTIVSDNPTLLSFAKAPSISLIFEQNSIEDLSIKISKILRDSQLAYRLAKEGQDFVYRIGNWNNLGKLIIKIYQVKPSSASL